MDRKLMRAALVLLLLALPGAAQAASTMVSPVITFTCSSHQFANQLDTTGTYTCVQPTFADVGSGTTAATATGLTISGGTLTGNTTLPNSGQLSSGGWLGIGGTPAAEIHVQGNVSAPAWTTNGIGLAWPAATYTDTTSSGTVSAVVVHNIGQPTLAASSSTQFNKADTLRIFGPPVAGTNVTIAAPITFDVVSGLANFGGNVNTTAQYQVNGSQITAANLGDDTAAMNTVTAMTIRGW